MSEKVKYNLFAMKTDIGNINKASEFRFSRITEEYILIYTEQSEIEDAILIEEKEVKRLTGDDSKWLFDCNMLIIAKETKSHEKEFLKDLSAKVNELEKMLEAEQKKVDEKEG